MSHPNWIRTELSRHFTALDLDKNEDGFVDVDEWRSFLKKNEASLTKFGWIFQELLHNYDGAMVLRGFLYLRKDLDSRNGGMLWREMKFNVY